MQGSGNREPSGVCREILAGITAGLGMLPGFVMIPTLLSRAGMDFTASYTACTGLAILSTLLLGGLLKLPVVAVCSVPIASWLVCLVILSHGHSWQAVLGASFLASLLCLSVYLFSHGHWFELAVPHHLRKRLPGAMGLMLILLGLMHGHLLVISPAGLLTSGNLADPAAFYTLLGILITAVLAVRKCTCAIFAGMLFTAVASFAEGFWVLPAAPILLPEGLERIAFRPDLPEAFSMPEVILMLALLQVTAVEGVKTALRQPDGRGIPSVVFGMSGLGAWMGSFPLTLAPESAIQTGTGISRHLPWKERSST